MQTVHIPFGKWYKEETHPIIFPDNWEVIVKHMKGAVSLDDSSMEKALDTPIGSPKLQEISQGKHTACILVDDITRPTRLEPLLKLIIKRLNSSGIETKDIFIIFCLGAHRPLTKQDMIKKIGGNLISKVQVFNHNPYEDLVSMGKSKINHPISINRRFTEADLKISVGCIIPHHRAGFAGGAKNIIPGIGGMDTLYANHSYGPAFLGSGNPDNPLRLDMEDISRRVGLDFIVNVVFNTQLEVAGLFAGDLLKAHRAGCIFASNTYQTEIVEDADVVILNTYPKDTDFVQIITAFNVVGKHPEKFFRGDNSTIIVTSACTEGAGHHGLIGPGMRLFGPYDSKVPPRSMNDKETWIYSPSLSVSEIRQFFVSTPPPLYNNWYLLLDDLCSRHGEKAKVAVYPLACIQMGH